MSQLERFLARLGIAPFDAENELHQLLFDALKDADRETHIERGTGFGWAIHHRRPKSKGGTSLAWVNAAANGVVLCEAHHRHVHANPAESYANGFLVRANGIQRPDEVAINHKTLGLVYLTDEGGWSPVEEGPTPESWGERS